MCVTVRLTLSGWLAAVSAKFVFAWAWELLTLPHQVGEIRLFRQRHHSALCQVLRDRPRAERVDAGRNTTVMALRSCDHQHLPAAVAEPLASGPSRKYHDVPK
eukprot:3940669-Rhodomonas_salina.10